MNTDVSIIVAAYNAADTLDRCLDSLLGQTAGQVQVVCVDDCSTDATPALLARRAKEDNRLLILRTTANSGLSAARNLALPHLTGRWTFTCDADDWISSDSVAHLLAAEHDHSTADALLFRMRKVYDDGREEPFADWPHSQTFTGREAIRLAVDWRIHGDYALPTKRLQAMPYDARTRIYSDDVTVREHLLTSQLLVQTEATYYFYQRSGSLTHTDGLSRLDFIVANTHLRDLLEHYSVDDATLRKAEAYIWRVYVGIQRRLTANRAHLSAAEWAAARQVLREALQAMRPDRLPHALRFNPHSLCLRPYALLEAYTKLLLCGRRLLHRNY